MIHHRAQPVKLERDLWHRLGWCMREHVVMYVEDTAGGFQLWFGVPEPSATAIRWLHLSQRRKCETLHHDETRSGEAGVGRHYSVPAQGHRWPSAADPSVMSR